MKIASRATPEGLAGHGLSTTVLGGSSPGWKWSGWQLSRWL